MERMVQIIIMGVGNCPNTKDQRKIGRTWGGGGTGHKWRECLTPREGNKPPTRLANHNINGRQVEETQSFNTPPVPAREESASESN